MSGRYWIADRNRSRGSLSSWSASATFICLTDANGIVLEDDPQTYDSIGIDSPHEIRRDSAA